MASVLDSLTDDVAHNLSAAVDLSKIMNVFNTFVGIIKDQQVKIDRADEEIRDLREKMEKMSAGSPERLESLEKKLDDFIQDIQGGGEMDKSILHADISPFDAFHNTIPPILEEDEEDDSTVESGSVRSPTRLPRLEEENSVASLDKDSIHDDIKAQLDESDPTDFIQDDESPTPPNPVDTKVEAPSAGDNSNQPSARGDQSARGDNSARGDKLATPIEKSPSGTVTPKTSTPAPEPAPEPVPAPAPAEVPMLPVENTTDNAKAVNKDTNVEVTSSLSRVPSNEEGTSSRATSARPHRSASVDTGTAAAGSAPRSARSYSILVNDQKAEDSPLLDEISNSIPLIVEAMRRASTSRPVSGRMATMRPLSASASAIVSGSGTALPGGRPISATSSRPLSGLNSGRKHNVVVIRRRMDVNNLPWLSQSRAKRMLMAIRMRGRFILISRRIMDESRKKYGAASLKNRIDVLEADLDRVNSRLESMKDTMKKNHAAVKELVSPDVNKLLEEMGKLLKSVSSMGGMDAFAKLLVTLKDTDLSLFSATGREQMMGEFSEKLQHGLLKDLKEQLDNKFAILSKEYVSKQDVTNMLRIGSAVEQNMDQHHLKLLQLIDRTVKPPMEILDTLRMEGEKKMQERMMTQQQEVLSTLESRQNEMQREVDERVRSLTQQVLHITKKAEGNDRIDDEFALVKAKLKKLEEERELLQIAREKEAQQRQAEHEALKILQRRLANISIDKLMEELKDVRDDIKDRPSTHQVEHMVGKIEKTFKSHLGENVNGLTNLVGQVYKYLQTKVDREDIRNLITNKLMQMEQELIYREEEMLSAAGTAAHAARCISCGQLPAVGRPRTTQSSQQQRNISSPQTSSGKFMTDESHDQLDQRPFQPPSSIVAPTPLTNSSVYSLQGNEQVYSLLTGQVGLRPLQLQHHPLQPRDPFHGNNTSINNGNNNNSLHNNSMHSSRPHTMATNRVKPVNAEKIPEPLYRKARMAAHMKEMVKVAAPALDTYGYHSGNNPFYVTDTPSTLNPNNNISNYGGNNKLFQVGDVQPSLTTLHNTFGNNNSNSTNNQALRGAGAHIIGSQSLNALPSSSGLDQPHSVTSIGNGSHHSSNNHSVKSGGNMMDSSRRVSAVNIDSMNIGDSVRNSAF